MRARGEVVLETGVTYDGIAPVRIHASIRESRITISDRGGAVAAAGIDPKRFRFAESIALGAYTANVSSRGIVSLPGFSSCDDTWLEKLVELVTAGSLALYETLLELGD